MFWIVFFANFLSDLEFEGVNVFNKGTKLLGFDIYFYLPQIVSECIKNKLSPECIVVNLQTILVSNSKN